MSDIDLSFEDYEKPNYGTVEFKKYGIVATWEWRDLDSEGVGCVTLSDIQIDGEKVTMPTTDALYGVLAKSIEIERDRLLAWGDAQADMALENYMEHQMDARLEDGR